MLRPLGLFPAGFTYGTAPHKFAAWDRKHFKLDPGSDNLLFERLHGRLELLDEFFDRLVANIDNPLWRGGEAPADPGLFAGIAAGLLEFQPLRPGGTLHDPVTQQVELLLRQRAALVGRRHQVIVVGRQRHGLVQCALLQIERHHYRTVFAGLKGVLALVEAQIALVVSLAVATDAGRLQYRLDVLDEVNPAHLLDHQPLRPLGPGGDPFLEHIGLVGGEWLALGRHDFVIVRRQNGGRVKGAFFRLAGDNNLAVLAALEQPGVGVQLQFALGLFLAVTAQAGRGEHRLDLFFKRHLGLGQAAQPSQRGTPQQQPVHLGLHLQRPGNVRGVAVNVNRRVALASAAGGLPLATPQASA